MSKYTLKIDLPEIDQLLLEARNELQARINELSRQFDIDRHTTLKEVRERQDKLYRDIGYDLKDINTP